MCDPANGVQWERVTCRERLVNIWARGGVLNWDKSKAKHAEGIPADPGIRTIVCVPIGEYV